jgi:chemotaxis protein histidine kinase CheA
MKRSNIHQMQKLQKRLLPRPEPDMTGWTSMERLNWHAQRRSLQELQRESRESTEPILTEVLDARDAEDEAILAERAAKAAAERLAEHPGSAAAQLNARATREAADKAKHAAEEAKRIAEEAKLRPPPPEPEPAIETRVPMETSAPAPVSAPKPKPKRPRKRRESGMPKPEKQWWEERAKWRMRGPQDEDERRGRPLYQCLVDYDPLEWDNDDGDDESAY